MNQVFAGGIALIIALILWSSRKNSNKSTFSRFKKHSFSQTQESSALVLEKTLLKQKNSSNLNNQKSNTLLYKSVVRSIETKKVLTKLISSSPEDRLVAMKIAGDWGNKNAIPFLLRGLKDSDNRVVIAAAKAISPFKGKTINFTKKSQTSRPPRNVSRMR